MAASDERRKLERDLHDGAQQALIAIGMRLRSAQAGLSTGSAEHADVETAIGQLGETVAEVRRISQGIRPARLDDGLGPALEALRESTPVPLTLRVDPAIDQKKLAEPVAQAVYFVVAWAVANALKHAHATSIRVEVDRGDGVHVLITDDGVRGVDPGSGLVALRDRVASVAVLPVSASEELGTVGPVRLRLPDVVLGRLVRDFDKLKIKGEVRPLMLKENTLQSLATN